MIRKTTAILIFIMLMFVVLFFLSSVYDWDLSKYTIYVNILFILALMAVVLVIFTELDYFFIISLARRSKELLSEIADRRDLDDSLRCGAKNAYSDLTAKTHWIDSRQHRHYRSIEWMRRYLNYLPEELAIKAIKLINSTRISKIISIFPLLLLLFWAGITSWMSAEYIASIIMLLITVLLVLNKFDDELVDYPIEFVLARRNRNIIDEIIDSDNVDNDIKSEARSVCNDKSGLSLYDRYIEWMKLNLDKLPAKLSIKMKREIWLTGLGQVLPFLIAIILVFLIIVLVPLTSPEEGSQSSREIYYEVDLSPVKGS